MRKKSRLVMLVMTGASILTLGLTACNELEPSGHNYSDDWSKDGTNHWHACLDEGCHESKDSASHTFGAPEVVAPATCYSNGEQKLTCTVCGYEKSEATAKISHNWSTAWDSNETEHFHKCLNDGCTETSATADHGVWRDGEVLEDATCTQDGEKELVCEVCDFTKTEAIPATGHTKGADVQVLKESTCVEKGIETSTCPDCGEQFETEIPLKEHVRSEETVIKEPTCTEEGVLNIKCAVCDNSYEESIPAKNHNYGEWEVERNHNLCTDTGIKKRYCQSEGCDAFEQEEVPPGEHRFGDWAVAKEAGCEEKGARSHTCVVCEFEEQEETPAKGHNYTQWYITKYPTRTSEGTATKYCAGGNEHNIVVSLPKLSETQSGYNYDSKTAVFNCTVSHEMGDITFKTYNIETIEDAVQVALNTQNQVIRADVECRNILISGKAEEAVSQIIYELGTNYVHIKDDTDKTERFYTLNDDGTMFAVLKSYIGGTLEGGDDKYQEYTDILISKDNSATLDAMNGYGYSFTFMNGGVKYHGVGSFIKYLYTIGKINANKDFVEGVKTVGGKTVYYFSYGYKFPSNNYFDVVNVEFSFDSNFIVSDAVLNVKTYAQKESAADRQISLSDPLLTQDNEGHYYYDGKLLVNNVTQTENGDGSVTHNYSYPTPKDGYIEADAYIDEDGTPRMRLKYAITFEQLNDGTYRVLEGKEGEWANSQTYTISQTSELGEGEELPTNPYKYEDFVISSFDIMLGDTVLDEGTELNVDANESVVLDIKNVLPSTYNPYFDEFSIYMVDEDGNRIEGANINNLNDGEIGCYFYAGNTGVEVTKDYRLTIKSLLAGEWDLYIVTANKQFKLHLVVNYVAPSPLYAEVKEVNDLTGKESWNRTLTNASVYQGQGVIFKGAVGHPAYENARYTVSVTKDGANVTESCLTMTADDGLPLYTFRAQELGTYTVTLTSAASTGTTASFTVTVKEAPDVTSMLTGEFRNEEKGYKVTLNPVADGELNGTATIVKGFDDNTETTVISYVYDAETHTFTCKYVSGAVGDYVQGTEIPYNYGLKLSDAYKLYLTYESGFNGKTIEVLIGGFENSLVCKDSVVLDKAKNENRKLIANVSGIYKITSNSSTTFISINGGENALVSSLGNVTLYVGDYIQIWNGMSSTPVTYTIELIEALKTVYVEDVSFEETTMVLRSGQTVTLNPVYTPSNTTQRGLAWTTSNAGIATVNENGEVTGVNTGTVTITATTTNGKCLATVEITVIGEKALLIGENKLVFTGLCWDENYTFSCEEGKTYIVKTATSGPMGGNVNYDGVAYNYPSTFEITGGEISMLVSQFSYGTTTITITITEKEESDEPESNFELLEVGETKVNVYPGYVYYSLAGNPGDVYSVTVGPDATLYKVEDKNAVLGTYKNKTMEYTVGEDGFVDICFYPGQGPGDYTITVAKV